jgi:tetratricopeptide (TPR) repeat protein
MRHLVIFALTASFGIYAQDETALYREAVDRQHQGDLTGAVQLYRQVLEKDPANIAARSNLGASLSGLGRFSEAVPEYQAAIENAPPQVRPLLERNLALAWYKSGHFAEAAPLLIALYKAQPADPSNAMLAADCFLQTGEPSKAIDLLEPLAPANSADKAFAYVLGIAYLKAGRSVDAQRTLDPLLKDTASAEGNYALGMAAFASGDYPAAVNALGRAIAIDPSLPHVQAAYGQALLFTGDPDAALAAFRKQLSADANDYEANFYAAAILARRGNHEEADTLLERAVSLRPKDPQARFALAESMLAGGKTARATSLLESLTKDHPDYGAAHARLAVIYAGSGLAPAAARERTLAAKYSAATEPASPIGLAPGAPGPRLRLAHSDGSIAAIPNPEPGKPAVLVFGSYSCPNFRSAAPILNELSKTWEGRIPFLLVYIREAHSTDQWQSTRNQSERIEMAPASTAQQKTEYAVMCHRKLHLRFPSAVDGLDNAAEQAYAAWPSRVYVIAASGRVLYASGLSEQEFDRRALEAAIRSALPRPTRH